MVLNNRSPTNQKDHGLSNSLNLTNQDFSVFLVDKKKTVKTIASLQAIPSPSHTHFDFPPFLQFSSLLRPATQAIHSHSYNTDIPVNVPRDLYFTVNMNFSM